ncbi:MAG: diaminopimelate decarboxylase [Streptosporangiaceae bacterium]|jgi:diaminopimelate decarboxylase|nr:diaminopimelate decarboxylase [Streptosporangiaceae bacterium]
MTGPDDLLGLFPPGTAQDGDGMLRIGGCRLDDLAAAQGTPVLVVAEQAVRQRARDYREQLAARWPDSQVVFASKAFPCTAVQRLMVTEGLWLDVAGGGEIVTALAAGADPATLVLHGNAKTTEEIELAVRSGVGTVVVDNEDDIDRLDVVVPAGRVQGCLVRVIPGVQSSTYPAYATGHSGSKFGLSPAAARQAISRIEASARLRMDGLHTHVGSQILVADELAAAVAPLAALGDYPVYDLGGGLGCRYTYTDQPPSLGEYLDVLTSAAREHLPPGARILIEPGRSVVAPNAVTVYRVTTVKPGATTFVAVDGGMGDNLEVALVGQRFEATIADRVGGGQPVTVVGRHCESGDVLSANVPLRDPKVGDLLVVPVTGAYCYTMSNNYNGARRIPVVLADDGNTKLVVRRERWDELLSRDL